MKVVVIEGVEKIYVGASVVELGLKAEDELEGGLEDGTEISVGNAVDIAVEVNDGIPLDAATPGAAILGTFTVPDQTSKAIASRY